MYKVDDATEFEDGNISILDLTKTELIKQAMYSEISDFLNTLKPKPGRSYLHVNMLGSSDIYGPTRNGDYFSSETLQKYYKTFQTTPAKFFKHHRNKKDSPSFGTVIFSAYNPVMQRIELIVEADEATSKEIDSLIAQGMFPKTSMACRLPYDVCSICGNKARTRDEYCAHLMFEMNKLYPDGRKVYAINDNNITWFDCSWVARPADPTSSILTKVAEDMPEMSAAERAEIEGFTEKLAKVVKWADLIKDIGDSGNIMDNVTQTVLDTTEDLPMSLTDVLKNYSLNDSLAAMASLGISPSLAFLAELIAKIYIGDGYEGIGDLVEGYMEQIPEKDKHAQIPIIKLESPQSQVNPNLIAALAPFVPKSSLIKAAIEKRAANIGSGVGYAHNGPAIEPTYEEQQEQVQTAVSQAQAIQIGYGKLLFGLGISALLAKHFISKEIDQRMREQQNLHVPVNYAKIGILKQSDYVVASRMSKASTAQYVGNKERTSIGGEEINTLGLARKLLKKTRTTVGKKLATILKTINTGERIGSELVGSVINKGNYKNGKN